MLVGFENKKPKIGSDVYVAPNATIIGNTTIEEGASIWFGSVIRADVNSIRVGKKSNIQDLAVLHVPAAYKIDIGNNVTVGHKALLHGCKIGDNCLIGMGAIIMDGVEIGENCIVGAGSLVTGGSKIPSGSMVFGSPAKVKRELTKEEVEKIAWSADHYYKHSNKYKRS